MIIETISGKTLRQTFRLQLADYKVYEAEDERKGIAPRNRSATGYGSKLPTSYEIKYEGRWRRVYTMIYSNAGVTYVIVKGEKIIVNDYWIAV